MYWKQNVFVIKEDLINKRINKLLYKRKRMNIGQFCKKLFNKNNLLVNKLNKEIIEENE